MIKSFIYLKITEQLLISPDNCLLNLILMYQVGARVCGTILSSNIYSAFLAKYMTNYKTSVIFILIITYLKRHHIIHVPLF